VLKRRDLIVGDLMSIVQQAAEERRLAVVDRTARQDP
jgi:hypothetical protein